MDMMTNRSQKRSCFLLATLFLCVTTLGTGQAQEPDRKQNRKSKILQPKDDGFFFNKETNQFFTNGKPRFKLLPLGNQNYLDHIQVSIDDQAFRKYENQISFQNEGLHTIRFKAVDPVLNWSPVQFYRIYVDLTPPETHHSWEGPHQKMGEQLFVNSKSRLILTPQDSMSGVQNVLYRVNGNRPRSTQRNPIQFKKEGRYDLQFASLDRVGNSENWNTLNFVVDGTPPTTKIRITGNHHKAGDKTFISSEARIHLEAVDGSSGLKRTEYRINKGPITSYNQPLFAASKNFVLEFRSVDEVGNLEKWQSIKLVHDSNPPQLAVRREGRFIRLSGKIFASPGFSLRLGVQDKESGIDRVLYALDGKNFQPLKKAQFTFSKPGSYRFATKAMDKVGNEYEGRDLEIVVDAEPPRSTVDPQIDLVSRNDFFLSSPQNRIKISGDDSQSGLDRIEYSFDGKNFETLKRPFDLATWKSSSQTIYYRAVDRLGNKEETKKLPIKVLSKGPKVDLFVESDSLPKVPLSKITKPNRQKRNIANDKKK
jgi:hypothetical protein